MFPLRSDILFLAAKTKPKKTPRNRRGVGLPGLCSRTLSVIVDRAKHRLAVNLVLGLISGPGFGSFMWPRFPYHRNDNERGEFARALADRGIPCKAPALLGMGLLLGPKGDPAFGSIFRPTFRYHTNDNEQSRYHCCDTESGAKYWTLKLTPRGLPKKGLRTSSRMSL